MEEKPAEESPKVVVPEKKSIPNLWKFATLFLILLILGGAGLFLATQKKQATVTSNPVPTSSPTTQSRTAQSGPLFTGSIKPISDQGIFVASETDITNVKDNGADAFKVDYFEAGTYLRGKYEGYKRIIALVHTPSQMGGYFISIFATKDNKNFIMDADPSYYDGGELVKSKVIKTEQLDSEHADQIDIDSHFTLNKIDLATSFDKNNNVSLITNFSEFKSLNFSNPNIKLYARPADSAITNPYFDGKTEIVAVDETGFAYFYSLTTKDLAAGYEIKNIDYKKALLDKNPNPPNYPTPPGPSLDSSEISQSGSYSSLYKKYSVAFPQACGGDYYTALVKNVTSSDLTKVGSTNNFDVYVISDKNNPIYKEEYKIKIYEASTFKEVNKVDPPSFDDYVSKHPLIFAKDPFGRWFALGEYDYLLMGGCGKPVLYFYPKTDTKVKVSFVDPVRVDLSIPNYSSGWEVLTHPGGAITDLRPQLTNCSEINTIRKGSEYAYNACRKNAYPYLYWEGQNEYSPYPRIDTGWIVAKSDLSSFIDKKLTEVGLNLKEKGDMEEYWVSQMLSKNSPYYRISFLQTQEMNKLIPMNISPAPDSFYRIFLDYMPLSEKPNIKISPPNLEKIERNGFTVVEWGGLNR